MLKQLLTCTLRTTIYLLLILQQPSPASTSLPPTLSHAPLAPPPVRPQSSLERVCSIGRNLLAGVFGYGGIGYVCRSSLSFLLLINHLLGYYVIAIILAVITALITIFHHQIVEKLTPAAHRVKTSVLSFFLLRPSDSRDLKSWQTCPYPRAYFSFVVPALPTPLICSTVFQEGGSFQ